MAEDLLEVVRHRSPMLLLDRIIQADNGVAETELTITPAASFFETGRGVPAWVGIEYMAQTVAVIAGTDARRNGQPLPTGYLLGTRKFDSDLPWYPPNAVLRVFAEEVLVDDNGLGAYNCRILIDGRLVAACRLTVYRRPLESATAHE